MEDIELHRFSVNSLVLLIVTGAVIYGVFYLLKNYILPFVKSRKVKRKMNFLFFKIQVAVWGLFICFALTELMFENFWITLALITLVIIAGYRFGRNFLSGLLFRLERKIRAERSREIS
jgi:uncharacterized membrane-anchored protein